MRADRVKSNLVKKIKLGSRLTNAFSINRTFLSQTVIYNDKQNRMKHYLLHIILFVSFVSNSQVNLNDNTEVKAHFEAVTDIDSSWYESGYFNTDLIVDFPDVHPLWNGQHKDFEKIIIDEIDVKLRSLKKALRKTEEVEIVLNFRVDEEGEIFELKVISGISNELDSEISRIVKDGKWTKGEHKGKPVPYLCLLRVKFRNLID